MRKPLKTGILWAVAFGLASCVLRHYTTPYASKPEPPALRATEHRDGLDANGFHLWAKGGNVPNRITIRSPLYKKIPGDSLGISGMGDAFGGTTFLRLDPIIGTDGAFLNMYLLPDRTGQPNYLASYPLTTGFHPLFDPQFSPNGRYILLKQDQPVEICGTYRFFVWDRDRNRLEPALTERLANTHLIWSPDSRYIAYLSGNEMCLGHWPCGHDVELWVYDVQTRRSRLVAHHNAGSLAILNFDSDPLEVRWGGAHTLLFTWRSGVYEWSPRLKEPHLLIRNAFGAASSPDGRWLTFHCNPDVHSLDDYDEAATGAGLYLYDRIHGTRRQIHDGVFPRTPLDVAWTPDSQRAYILENSPPAPGVTETTSASTTEQPLPIFSDCAISVLDVATGRMQKVDFFQIKDEGVGRYSGPGPMCQIQGLTADGTHLILSVGNQTWRRSWCSVNLEDGAISNLAPGAGSFTDLLPAVSPS